MLIISSLFLLSCEDDAEIWTYSKAELLENLHSANFSFLSDIVESKMDLREVNELGQGAAYALALHALEQGFPKQAEEFFLIQWEEQVGPWSLEAAKAFLRMLLEREEFAKAETFSRGFLEEMPENPDFGKALIEALYWQEKDEEVGEALKRFASRQLRDDPEIALIQAVVAFRNNSPDFTDNFDRLFLDYSAHAVHIRLVNYLDAEAERWKGFDPAREALFRFKYDIAAASYQSAFQNLELFFEKRNQLTVKLSKELFWDMYRAARGSAQNAKGADYFDNLSEELEGDLSQSALEYAARLYYHAADYRKAIRITESLVIHYGPGEKRDRMIWYNLQSVLRYRPDLMFSKISRYYPSMSDLSYFNDVLEDFIARLLQKRDWAGLRKAYVEFAGKTGAVIRSHLALLNALSVHYGLYTMDIAAEETKHKLLSEVLALRADPYDNLIAASILGVPDKQALFYRASSNGPGQAVPGEDPKTYQILVPSLLNYGHFDRAYHLISKNINDVRTETVINAIRELDKREQSLESLRLFDLISDRKDFSMTRETAEYAFPLRYEEEVRRFARIEEVDVAVFYGLMRQESLFSPDIVSYAGAVGLSQLMPDTAADMARRMGIDDSYDLTDPATNISIGTRYLNWLNGRFTGTLYALSAYNAGQSRVKKWIRRYGSDFPRPFFAEAIPFSETRAYVKKCITASVYYGCLYEGRGLREAVEKFFPDLPDLSD